MIIFKKKKEIPTSSRASSRVGEVASNGVLRDRGEKGNIERKGKRL